jgi:5-formaminoimidazole-4-carboxamide-1-beta-D-ribofuranosyl 5'-monophosphate synthetase
MEAKSIDIIVLIPKGESNRITSSNITKLTNVDGATIRRLVNEARSKFVPIASDARGYFVADKPEELNHTIAQLNSRIHKMIKAREGLKKAQKLMKEINNGII